MRHQIVCIYSELKEFTKTFQIPFVNFNPNEFKLKNILYLFPVSEDFPNPINNGVNKCIMPLGIVLKGKSKLHFNLLYIENGKCWRFEPHRHVTFFYNEKRLNKYLRQVFGEYNIIYEELVGNQCVQDSFQMVGKFIKI